MDEQNLNVVDATQENVVDSQTNAENTTVEQVQTTEQTVNADNGEVATPKVEEKPTQSAEDNAKFAAIRREAEQKARDKARDELIAEMYGESHGIKTYAEYQEAVKKAQEEAEIQSHIDKGIDPEIAKELAEAKKFRQQYKQEQLTKQQQEKQKQDFKEFLDTYPDIKAEDIPPQVWAEVDKGTPLKIAYGLHENAILKAKLAEYEKGSKTQQINATNAESSTGSVTGNGSPNDGFISYDTFEANKNDRNWVMKNFKQISESRAKW